MKKEKEYGTMTMTDFPDLTLFSGEGSENTGVTAAAAGQQEENSPIRAQNSQAAAKAAIPATFSVPERKPPS